MPEQQWREEYEGGSAEAERLVFEKLAGDIKEVQVKIKENSGASEIKRAFHAKLVLGVTNARLRILDEIPKNLQVGHFRPNREYQAIVRLSNANGAQRADYERDLRGAAVRVQVSDREFHDLLMTNFPVSHARNARQFVAFAKAMAGSKALGVLRLFFSVGPLETFRMLRNVSKASGRSVRSLALETYWSRGAILWGAAGPVRYLLRPAANAPSAGEASKTDPDYLRHELAERLRRDDIVFDLLVQPYVDAKRTPIEDGAVEWTEAASVPVRVASLTIPKQDIGAGGQAAEQEIDRLAFSPWHAGEEFRPLGNLNRARKPVYEASSAHRLGQRTR
jgi:catalase